MDFMKLFAAVLAVLFQPGSNSGKANGQMICRRGTERPCYKVSNVQGAKRRPTFEDARQTCRSDGGELLSIETESEQRLVEHFIQQLQAGDRDFWIVLRQSQQRHGQGATIPGCPSRFYWLEGSKAKFRNWHWGEPSCHGEMCVVLYDQQSPSPDGEGHFLFQWSGNNCNSKNNVVCKYPEEKAPVLTRDKNVTRAAPVPSLKPKLSPTTESDDKTKIASPESSVSLSENTLHVHYIVYATVPALLLLLFAAVGFFCYRKHTKRRKTETSSHPSRSPPWMPTTAPLCPVQGPYAFSDITKLPHATPGGGGMPVDIMTKYFGAPSPVPQCDDYENVPCANKESGFVTNDIYETCRAQSRRCRGQTGWVENEIYG